MSNMLKDNAPKEFASKIDAWLIVLLAIAVLYPIGIGIFVLITDHKHGMAGFLATLGSSILVALIVWLLAIPVLYTVADGLVKVRAGKLIRVNVAIKDIVEVSPSRSLISSPALSMDRLAIKVSKNGSAKLAVLISPDEKSEFMILLSRIDNGLFYDGTKLTRTG